MDSYSSEEGASPKRLKANDQSSLPVSILKDNVSSETEETDYTDRRKSRKSMGRRVSFAPTAHVRMFEIPEEKQPGFQGSGAYVMPDISSQTGVAGFSLGSISTIEETSMASNDSFDVSVRHSDPSESAHSSENSFLTELQQESATNSTVFGGATLPSSNGQSYINFLGSDDADDDDDDDLDENDGDDDAVTMELTGTVDMSVVGADSSDDDDNGEEDNGIAEDIAMSGSVFSHANDISSHAMPFAGTSDAESFLNMLLQGNATAQDTGLLDNILSQFESTQQLHTLNHTTQSAADADYTRVGIAMDEDDETRDVTMHASLPEQTVANRLALFGQASAPPFGHSDMDDEDDEEVDSHEDAVTMDLTGIFTRPPPSPPVQQVVSSEPVGQSSTAFLSALGPILQSPQQYTSSPAGSGAFGITATSSHATSVHATPLRTPQRSTQRLTSESLAETLETLIAATPSANTPSRVTATASSRASERVLATPVNNRATPSLQQFGVSHAPVTPGTRHTPLPAPHSASGTPRSAPRQHATPRASSSSSRPESATPTPSRASARARRSTQSPGVSVSENTADDVSIEEPMPEPESVPVPSFRLDPLPAIPSMGNPPLPMSPSGPATLADHARAALVFGIFDVYRQQELVPRPLPDHDPQAAYATMFEPLYRKAKLTARLEYCSSLASLFEVDRSVSQAASATQTDFGPTTAYFEEQNGFLALRKEELLLRISKTKQQLMADAPSVAAGGMTAEIRELKAKLGDARKQRESVNVDAERLSREIRALQTTGSSFDRQVTEKKSAQNILLAINGLQLVDAAEDRCDFAYDKFTKLHLDTTAEFTSLHPDIDWVAVVKDNSGRADSSMRQDAISAMKTNVVIKELLEDVKQVKRHTFVDLSYNDGVQVRMQFFSKAHRRRFYLQISLGVLSNYRQLHKEARFDWTTEVVYGDVDSSRLGKCLRACRVNVQSPLLSIYQHVNQSMDAF
ncbi:hypothetical protein GGI20_001805 [Coemansia sp. BCRC 34301]|nr:hypothetical protein GGI20_001805 [Coemansia sp. BCRC 34301]